MAISQTPSTTELLELCVPLFEDRYHRCPHEMWCFITMYSGFSLVKFHLGKETWQTAKAACAQRFLALYFKHPGKGQQATSDPNVCFVHSIFPFYQGAVSSSRPGLGSTSSYWCLGCGTVQAQRCYRNRCHHV